MSAQFEIFTDVDGKPRWRLKAANGEIVAQSEAYESLTGAVGGIDAVRAAAASATVEDLTGAAGGG